MNASVLLEKIRSLSNKQKSIALVLLCGVVVGSWIWFIQQPKKEKITELEEQVAGLSNQISINRTKAMRIAELKRENVLLQRRLTELKEQLPPAAEVAILLKQVSELGIRTGLDFKLWRPGRRTQNPEGLYTEIPVSVEVAGDYHALGAFFDKIARLSRIVNVSSIRMGSPKTVKDKVLVQTSFVATAFAASGSTPQSE